MNKNRNKLILSICLVLIAVTVIGVIIIKGNHKKNTLEETIQEEIIHGENIHEENTHEENNLPVTAEITISPKPTESNEEDESFMETMYDYSFAGMKSSKKRVKDTDYISVTEYGVTPDSGQEESIRVINAIKDTASKGKYLYFPKGTYYVKNVKIYDTDNVKICGDGEETVLKTADDAVGEVKWDITMGFYRCNNLTVRNLTFDGNNKKVAGNTEVGVLQLRIENCENANVYGCRFQNNNSGNINIVGHAEGLKIFYCDFLNSDCSVIVMPGYITNGYICNNYIDGQEWEWSEPISFYNSPKDDEPNSNVIISGNDIRNHTQSAGGIFITYPSKDIYVLDNYFYRCGAAIGSGTRLQTPEDDRGPWNIQCRNNVIESPIWHGFGLLFAEGWTIEDNTITDITDGFAVYLDRCNNCVVKNNSIDVSRVYQVDCHGNIIMYNK